MKRQRKRNLGQGYKPKRASTDGTLNFFTKKNTRSGSEKKENNWSEFLNKHAGAVFFISCLVVIAGLMTWLIRDIVSEAQSKDATKNIQKVEEIEELQITALEPKSTKKSIEETEVAYVYINGLDKSKPRQVTKIYLDDMTQYEKKRLGVEKDAYEQKWLQDAKTGYEIYTPALKLAVKNSVLNVTYLDRTIELKNPKMWKNEEQYILLGIANDDYEVDDIHQRDLMWIEFTSSSQNVIMYNLGNADLLTFSQEYSKQLISSDCTWILTSNNTLVSAVKEGEVVASAGGINEDETFNELGEYMLSNKGILYSVRSAKVRGKPIVTLVPEDTDVDKLEFSFWGISSTGEKCQIPVYSKGKEKYILLPELDNLRYNNFEFNTKVREIKPFNPLKYDPEKMVSSIYFSWDENEKELRETWVLDFDGYQGKKTLNTGRKVRCSHILRIISEKKYPTKMWDSLSYREYLDIISKLQKTIDDTVKKDPEMVRQFLKAESKNRSLSAEEKKLLEDLNKKEKAEKEKAKKKTSQNSSSKKKDNSNKKANQTKKEKYNKKEGENKK